MTSRIEVKQPPFDQIAPEIKQILSEVLFLIRGLAIFLVVVGHVVGERTSGIRQLYERDNVLLAELYDFIYTFHMPTFFIVAGISFSVFSSKNNQLFKFLRTRFQRLIVPLLFWAPLYYVLRSFTEKENFSPTGLLEAIIYPDFIFWFFHTLFLISIFSYLALRVPVMAYVAISVLLLVVSFVTTGFFSMVLFFNFFYAAGVLLGSRVKDKSQLPLGNLTIPTLVASIALLSVLMIAIYLYIASLDYAAGKLVNGLLGFLGIYLIALLSHVLGEKSSAILAGKDFVKHLGRISMSIYLMHVLFGSTTRTILAKLGVTDLSAQFVIGVLAATFGPLAVDAFLRSRSKLFLYSIGESK